MKPVVGVMPLWDENKDSVWMLPGYLDALRQAGALPLIFPLTEDAGELEQLLGLCAGVLLTGGHDVSPALYREAPSDALGPLCPERDAMETAVLRLALERDLPVFGICRGLQLLNVCLGGTLYQDLPTQHPSETGHRQAAPYDRPSHGVRLAETAPLRRCLGLDSLRVNSCHHQAIRDLAPALEPMAFAPDGLIEAVWMPERRFVWAVQWHPEFAYKTDAPSRKLFRAFAEAMEGQGHEP